jgi:hypothetical protein
MKKLAVLILTFLMLLSTTSCFFQSKQDKLLASVGKCENEQFWSSGGFQDYTDFGIYTYTEANLDDNKYLSVVTEDDIEIFCSFVDDFEEWVDAIEYSDPENELVLNYSFDRSVINEGDYFFIYEDEDYPKYGCYDLWFFDKQSNKLYYFHTNI